MTSATLLRNVNGKTKDEPIRPYRAEITITGRRPLLFHNYSPEAVEQKSKAKKGSDEKKRDWIETYVYKTEQGILGIPGLNFTTCLAEAARYKQDPRSPRKSARDLFKAGVIPENEVEPFIGDPTTWDFVDQRRVGVQRSAVTRERPGMLKGWQIRFGLEIILPEYITPDFLLEVANDAGRFCGLCDFRPIYGTFQVSRFEAPL